MNNFTVLAKKEFVQMVREFKVIWLPLVFIFLGLTQPVVSYYLPSILKALGGGQGITIDPSMAAQKGGEVLASTLGSQFDQLGVMIIIVSMMGVVQSDKANGMLAFILTRPVTVVSYISGKVISNYLFVACSVVLGYLVSYLYVILLFTRVDFVDLLVALLFYLMWILFIVSFTTMISTIFNSQGIIALISIVFLLGCRIVVGLSPVIDNVNPASMSKHAMEVLILGTVNTDVIWSVISTIVLSALTILVTNIWISKKKFNNE
ncbi:ABC transporter permease [Peribacillus butanolivorans]|uniref:ABC transporter permease n=1 Tax=Peribacillus TaxID=2675229 RepID=UPI0019121BA1|nr:MULTISPECIES: ABC transporter permease subunit [Peribacillus]MBK5444822.1 ABC transporter permease subunit [Peribacillus sp. TH24]MBK5460460.1 ABC transporter permease subunit [Peribacillus sp. TH27]MBK5482250.1 ABC transporter permease subunit [Peribacillus sp. TH16]MBK5498628.1 ABC transporter permease subunit [Peribacillus sp. TH14]MED3688363.1 ABC transporter permease subunit [Peribacillus butanolivorans]